MGSRNRDQHRPALWHSEGLLPGDSIGNRRSFRELKVPADDVGNRTDTNDRFDFIRDDIGNSIDIAPTHSLSSSMVGADGKTRRRKEDYVAPIRVGRYIMGGVNPVVAGTQTFAPPNEEIETTSRSDPSSTEEARFESDAFGSRNKKRRRKRKNDVRLPPIQDDFAERRLRRLFDFDDDDRIEYILSSEPEQKRAAAEETVRTIFEKAGFVADINAILLKNDNRVSVLVVIDENIKKGLNDSEGVESSHRLLFSRGSIELGALNFIVNKIVNRYPNDRIRLAVLPKVDEEEYVKSFYALANVKSAQVVNGESEGDETDLADDGTE